MSAAAAPGFNSLKFEFIGKEPALLSRFSAPQPGVDYYDRSPSPDARNHEDNAPNRPSLLQTLHPQFGRPSPSEEDSMDLRYPESTPSPPPFVPDYMALKELLIRLGSIQAVLAVPLSAPKPTRAPPLQINPSLVAAQNTLKLSESLYKSAQDQMQLFQSRLSVSEQKVASCQGVVSSLTQALSAAQASLALAQKSLAEDRRAADEARAFVIASRTTTEAAAATKHILETPPLARSPTPEPLVNPHAGITGDMKQVIDNLQAWVHESEVGHSKLHNRRSHAPFATETSPKVKVEEDNTNNHLRGDARKQFDVNNAAQKASAPTNDTKQRSLSPDREATLRQMQEAKREQIRIEKQQAHAEAAKMILKEREDATERRDKSAPAPSSRPPPNTAPIPKEGKPKGKKSNAVTAALSGGVKLGSEANSQPDGSSSLIPSIGSPTVASAQQKPHGARTGWPPKPVAGNPSSSKSTARSVHVPMNPAEPAQPPRGDQQKKQLSKDTKSAVPNPSSESTHKSTPSGSAPPPPPPADQAKLTKAVPKTASPVKAQKPVSSSQPAPRRSPSPPRRRDRRRSPSPCYNSADYDQKWSQRYDGGYDNNPYASDWREESPPRTTNHRSSWDHYSPPAPESYYPPYEHPSRSVSYSQKRSHEPEYPISTQKRLKRNDGSPRAAKRTLEDRMDLGAEQNREHSSEGLLSRISMSEQPHIPTAPRGRGASRSRGRGVRGGRGRGESRSLVDRMG